MEAAVSPSISLLAGLAVPLSSFGHGGQEKRIARCDNIEQVINNPGVYDSLHQDLEATYHQKIVMTKSGKDSANAEK